jgi:hypothetical protein
MVAITQSGDPEGEFVQEPPFTDIRDVGNFHTRGPNPKPERPGQICNP